MANIRTAETDTDTTDDGIEIELVNIDDAGLKYDAHVQKLIASDAQRTDEQIASGLHASVRLTFPKQENGKPAIERYKRWFRESAAAHDVSAKVISETDKGENIEFRYCVVPKITRPRKAKPADAPVDTSDVPETVPSAA